MHARCIGRSSYEETMQVLVPEHLGDEEADPKHFTGRARMTAMRGVAADPDVNAYGVAFQAGARTAWHTHSGVQLLVVLEGTCWLQKEGESRQDIPARGLASIQPGEKHWHGAGPQGAMVHLAINIGATTTWLEQVTDRQYRRA
ncbi:MAG: cupin [Acidobacteria bacterium]|jgi:quercetin dioxygenase-like cupin family protein|nr:cupin [Acidobacteriota bacterium]